MNTKKVYDKSKTSAKKWENELASLLRWSDVNGIYDHDIYCTTEELYDYLTEFVGVEEPSLVWPQNYLCLAHDLRRISSDLHQEGIDIVFGLWCNLKNLVLQDDDGPPREYPRYQQVVVLTRNIKRFIPQAELSE